MTLLEAVVAILVAAVTSAGAVLGVVLPVLISTRRKADAAAAAGQAATAAGVAAKEAVTNGHTEHIRDMLDRFHHENQEAIQVVVIELGGVKSDIRGMRRDVGRVSDRQEYQERRMRRLELRELHRQEAEEKGGE